MGMLQPEIAQIREGHLDFILGYFVDGNNPLNSPDSIDLNDQKYVDLNDELEQFFGWTPDRHADQFLSSFLGRFPDLSSGRPGALDPRQLASCVEEMKSLYRENLMTRGEWMEKAAFEAIRACGVQVIGGGTEFTALAQDANYQSNGDCWRFLDEVCTDRADRDVAVSSRKLMLDRDQSDGNLLPLVQADVDFIALLRPEEVRRLHAAVPLLKRFHAAVPQSEDSFREDLQHLIDYIASVDAEDICLFCWSTTS